MEMRDAMKPGPDRVRLTGRILKGLVVLFLLFAGAGKVLALEPAVEGMIELGVPGSAVTPIGVSLVVSTILYAIPRTALLGAILLTGYLGGAVATHVGAGDALLTQALFPAYLGTVVWVVLLLADRPMRGLLDDKLPVASGQP